MRKCFFMSFVIIIAITLPVNAASWTDSFATRLMKLMTTERNATDVVLTDIDCNEVPEAFLISRGDNGRIAGGITLEDNVLVSLAVPANVTGLCLEDITVYDLGDSFVYVGKEVLKGTSRIHYFELTLKDRELSCVLTEKSKYADYPSIAYRDCYSTSLHTSGYPDRQKISAFLNTYRIPGRFIIKEAAAGLSINENPVNVSGFNIDDNNYYKLRDIAMVLRGTDAKFEVLWNAELKKIEIQTGVRYTQIGTELEHITEYKDVVKISSNILVDGRNRTLTGYNIDGSTYFKIRDIGAIAGFKTGWDADTGTVIIDTE